MLRAARWMILASPLVVFAADISPQVYLEHVKYLASPELKGRATGSPELEKAAAYIASQFQSFGLKPADGKDFEQAFPAELGAKLGAANGFSYTDAGINQTLREGRDYEPFAFSTNGKFAGPVVFAG